MPEVAVPPAIEPYMRRLARLIHQRLGEVSVRTFLRHLAALSALLGVTSTALAGVVTFDALNPSYGAYAPSLPFLGHGDVVVEGNYAIGLASTKAGAQPGDLVGAVLDGSDPIHLLRRDMPWQQRHQLSRPPE